MNRGQKLKAVFARCDDNTLIKSLRTADARHADEPGPQNALVRTWCLNEVEKRFPDTVRAVDDEVDALFEEDENRSVNYTQMLLAKLAA